MISRDCCSDSSSVFSAGTPSPPCGTYKPYTFKPLIARPGVLLGPPSSGSRLGGFRISPFGRNDWDVSIASGLATKTPHLVGKQRVEMPACGFREQSVIYADRSLSPKFYVPAERRNWGKRILSGSSRAYT